MTSELAQDVDAHSQQRLVRDPFYDSQGITLWNGDALEIMREMPAKSVDMVLTSPPYNLGNTTEGGFAGVRMGHYKASDPLGAKRGGGGKWNGGKLASGYEAYNDAMPHDEYVAWQHEVLTECWRLLKDDGAIYYNHKTRVLDGIAVTPLTYNPGLPLRQIVVWARAGGVNFSPAFYLPTHEWVMILAKPDFRLRDKAARAWTNCSSAIVPQVAAEFIGAWLDTSNNRII